VLGIELNDATDKCGSRFDLPHETLGIEGVQNFAAREPTAAGYGDAILEI
jgi:hypothetical protein